MLNSHITKSKDEEILGAWAEFFVSFSLAFNEISKVLAQEHSPLTLDEYDVLLVLSRSPESRLRLSNLAEATVYTKSGITRIVNRLGKKKLLIKANCPTDKRGSYAVLTPSGREALKITWKAYEKGILENFGKCFSKLEAKHLRVLLSKLTNEMSSNLVKEIRIESKRSR